MNDYGVPERFCDRLLWFGERGFPGWAIQHALFKTNGEKTIESVRDTLSHVVTPEEFHYYMYKVNALSLYELQQKGEEFENVIDALNYVYENTLLWQDLACFAYLKLKKVAATILYEKRIKSADILLMLNMDKSNYYSTITLFKRFL